MNENRHSGMHSGGAPRGDWGDAKAVTPNGDSIIVYSSARGTAKVANNISGAGEQRGTHSAHRFFLTAG